MIENEDTNFADKLIMKLKEYMGREVERKIINYVLNKKDEIIKKVIDEVAGACLIDINYLEKEELRKKVEEQMVKKRSYRADLLDLDD